MSPIHLHAKNVTKLKMSPPILTSLRPPDPAQPRADNHCHNSRHDAAVGPLGDQTLSHSTIEPSNGRPSPIFTRRRRGGVPQDHALAWLKMVSAARPRYQTEGEATVTPIEVTD